MSKFVRPIVNGIFLSSPFVLYYQNNETVNSRFKVSAAPKVSETVFSKSLNKFSKTNPKPIQIAQRLDNGRLWINMQDLNEILDKVGTNEVGVYAICGPSRTGKSFLLTRCVEYLLSPNAISSNAEESAEAKACNPFMWNNQTDPLTSGIWIWSEPLEVIFPEGKKVYVLLVDCQGCFDEGTSINEDANIFAFSTLLSSVQIFNIKHQIDESTLQFLELFTAIARRIKLTCLKGSTKSSDVSFQKLTILVRDFQLKGYDYGYSNANGPATANYKVDKLDPKSHQPVSHQRERSNIITSYQECGVFLLPHPGKRFTASDDPEYLDEDYLQTEKEFFDVLFNPTNIVVKTVNGATQNGTTLKTHVEQWAEELENSKLPELPRTSESVNRFQLLDAIEGAKHKYRSEMELHLRGNYYQIAEEKLHKKHKSMLEEILSTFSSHLLLFGGNEEERKFAIEVEKNLREIYQNMQDKNLLKTVHRWYHYIGNPITWLVPVVGYVCLKFFGFA